jgi:uncharacterized protein GlcG (DUF336 family)
MSDDPGATNLRGERVNRNTSVGVLLGGVALLSAVIGWAAPAALPGDRGRPMDGVMPAPGAARAPRPAGEARPAAPAPAAAVAPAAPSLKLALKAATAIAEGCKQYPLGIAVTDAAGVAKLIYVPDGSETWHGYSAVRKAYTAIVFQMDTSQLVQKAQTDAEIGAKVRADLNLQAFSGGLLLKAGDKIVGALAVSGAEPGGHDEECGLIGLQAIKSDLK